MAGDVTMMPLTDNRFFSAKLGRDKTVAHIFDYKVSIDIGT